MTRKYSTMTAKEVAAEREWGIFDAKKHVLISKMLDQIESTKDMTPTLAVIVLADIMSAYIKYDTGVE